jgi:hypothetical protein
MVALYRSGRQAEALETYRRMRSTLVDELGIEPSRALQELERAILTQDRSLDGPAPDAARQRSILVVAGSDAGLDTLSQVARPLAAGCEVILARLVAEERDFNDAVSAANARRGQLGPNTRSAAFLSSEPARDILRLVSSHDVELVLLDTHDVGAEVLPGELTRILEHSSAHVAVVPGTPPVPRTNVVVPFGGGDHDWTALELAAVLASSANVPLTLMGTRGRADGRRNASRLLADASVVIQRFVDIDTQPVLVEPSSDALVGALAEASCVVVGISPRWRREGIGATRRALCAAGIPLMLVHRGLRPGVLAPKNSRTSFTWSLQS